MVPLENRRSYISTSRHGKPASPGIFNRLANGVRYKIQGPARADKLIPFWRDLGPALDVLQHKRGSQLAVRAQKEKMLASNFRSGCNHRLRV